MSLSEPIMSLLGEFESAFSYPTWSKIQVLILGTLIARGRRTVTAALRQMGLGEASNFSRYHHGLKRWIVLALVMTPPWTQWPWALPVLSTPPPTPEVSQRVGRRHKTVPQRARQMILGGAAAGCLGLH